MKLILNGSSALFNNETGQSFEIPVIPGSEGPKVLDIRSLYKDTGMFTFDPGFTSTASCESAITYIDGHKGILRHRGYDIKDLATNSDFLEVCYLLLHSNLPSPEDKKKFENVIMPFSSLSICDMPSLQKIAAKSYLNLSLASPSTKVSASIPSSIIPNGNISCSKVSICSSHIFFLISIFVNSLKYLC